MQIFTIGFTKKSAQEFFSRLKKSGAKRVVDVRLKNVSQLAGFAKREDLPFFLKAICGMEYVHLPVLAPTQEMLDSYRQERQGWLEYQKSFITLLRKRKIERVVAREVMENGCLLCSEDTAENCHRRVVAEYFKEAWGDVAITHL